MITYYMKKKCKIRIKNHNMIITLYENPTAENIWKKLPLKSKVSTWGEEIYFFVDIHTDVEPSAKNVIELGEIVYWPKGPAIAIGFGKTPISINEEIRLADMCNVWGKTDYPLKELKNVISGDEVLIEKF